MNFTEFMAVFALAAFWLNTLLIAAAGWSECAGLRRRYAYLARGTGRAEVRSGAGPDGALAAWRVVQVGRSNGRGPILFHDRARESAVFGGTIVATTGASELAPGTPAEVWIGAAARRRAVAVPDAQSFAARLPAAARAAGWERDALLPLRTGDTIWFAGRLADPAAGRCSRTSTRGRWRTRITALTAVFVVGVAARWPGRAQLACLWPPVFGTVSKLGAFAALVAFNLFQLLGKLHHDAIQPPAAAISAGPGAGEKSSSLTRGGRAGSFAGMRRVFVTGGSGFVGRNLLEALQARHVPVVALARSDAAAAACAGHGARVVRGDLDDVDGDGGGDGRLRRGVSLRGPRRRVGIRRRCSSGSTSRARRT